MQTKERSCCCVNGRISDGTLNKVYKSNIIFINMWRFFFFLFATCQARTIYKVRTMGLCTAPYFPILDRTICQTQALAVGWSSTVSMVSFSSYLPSGCVLKSSTDELRLYTGAGSNHCSDDYQCLCEITAPDCKVGINENDCICSQSLCTSTSGFDCTASGTCEHAPVCLEGDNDAVCNCGLVDCTPDTGLKCTAGVCSHAEICPNRIGTEINSNTCLCGSVDCSPVSGVYCHSESSACRKPCPGGTFVNHLLECTDCTTHGFYCPAGATISPTTFKCPAGRFGHRGGLTTATECSACSAGRYSIIDGITSNEHCTGRCPAGRWSSETGLSLAVDCAGQCGAGKFSSRTGLVSEAECSGRCGAGKFSSSTGLVSNDQCTDCSAGRYSSGLGLKTDADCTGRCSVGKYSEQTGLISDNECKVCNVNKYQNEKGRTSCKGCPDNKVIADTFTASKHDTVADCTETISVCTASEFVENNQCKSCEATFFCDGTSKLKCPPGNYCPGDGPAYQCPVGRYGSGTGQITLEDACSKCHEGTYQNVVGQTYCARGCPRGKFGQTKGAVSEKEGCILCPIGHMCGSTSMNRPYVCPLGSYQSLIGSEDCIFCPIDTYSDKSAATVCTSCGKNKEGEILRTSGLGANSPAQCEILEKTCPTNQRPLLSGQCEDCSIGFFGNGKGTRCILCPVGFYQPSTGSSDCLTCSTKRCAALLGVGDLSLTETMPVWQGRNRTSYVTENNPFPVGIVIVYSSLLGLIVLIICGHRLCPHCFKHGDLMFSGDHVIEDTHARRILSTRLGAAFTLIIPLIVAMIAVFVFTSDNTLTQNGLVPIATTDIPHTPGLYQNISITYTTESASIISNCSSIVVQAPGLDCNTNYFKTSQYTCAIELECSVNPPFGGTHEVLFILPDHFQRARCSLLPSMWNGTQFNITSAIVSDRMMTGTLDNPTTVDFDAVRSKMHNHFFNNISYGLQMTPRATNIIADDMGTKSGRHYVVLRFFSTETLFIREILPKLDIITQIGTVLTLTISALSGLRVAKLGIAILIDTLYIKIFTIPPNDITQRLMILEEREGPAVTVVPPDVEQITTEQETIITILTDEVTGKQYTYNSQTRESTWVEESL